MDWVDTPPIRLPTPAMQIPNISKHYFWIDRVERGLGVAPIYVYISVPRGSRVTRNLGLYDTEVRHSRASVVPVFAEYGQPSHTSLHRPMSLRHVAGEHSIESTLVCYGGHLRDVLAADARATTPAD